MRNRDRVVAALRDAVALAYSELRERSGVPVGSFDRTLAALVGDGTVLKGDDGYRLADDGSTSKPEETRVGSGIFVYCARTIREPSEAPERIEEGPEGASPFPLR